MALNLSPLTSHFLPFTFYLLPITCIIRGNVQHARLAARDSHGVEPCSQSKEGDRQLCMAPCIGGQHCTGPCHPQPYHCVHFPDPDGGHDAMGPDEVSTPGPNNTHSPLQQVAEGGKDPIE